MATADGFRRAHRPLGLLRVLGQGRPQVGRAGRRRLPPDASAAVLWWPSWTPEERLDSRHNQPRRRIISSMKIMTLVFPGSNLLPNFISIIEVL